MSNPFITTIKISESVKAEPVNKDIVRKFIPEIHSDPANTAQVNKSNKFIPRKVIKSSLEKQNQQQQQQDLEYYLTGSNSFVDSAFKAYCHHHELVIRPDDIWISIMTQFSFYVNKNENQLRSRIGVDFAGKQQLMVVSDGSLYSAPYGEIAKQMCDKITKAITDKILQQWVTPNFTTTTESDRIAGSIVLMSTMKQYFTYYAMLLCGLPSVSIYGTLEDWQEIRKRLDKLLEYDFEYEKTSRKLMVMKTTKIVQSDTMKQWHGMLAPILDQIISSVQGNPDIKWWNRIVNRIGGGSGPSYLSGWITAFCVFDKDGNFNTMKQYQGMSFDDDDKDPLKTEWVYIDIDQIPSGVVVAPMTINDNGTVYESELCAGHMVFQVGGDDSTQIIPRIDWCLLLKE